MSSVMVMVNVLVMNLLRERNVRFARLDMVFSLIVTGVLMDIMIFQIVNVSV